MTQTPGHSARPLSPFLLWRWHITMACSILHRVTGVALYGGALILAAWAVALASGPASYGIFKHVLGSAPGKVVLFGLTVSIFYHLAAGVRHLAWDIGIGLNPKTSDMTGAASIAFAIVASAAVWAIAAITGAL